MLKLLRAVAIFTLQCSFAHSAEGGGSNYLPGFYGDFGMAVFPGQGTYFNNFFAAYQDTASQTGTLLEMPGFMHITSEKFLGGQFLLGIYPALLASKDYTGDGHNDRFGLGDFYLVPGGLNWTWNNVSALLFEGIVAPTGRYEVGGLNLGRNYWTFDHNLLLTLSLPANNELSVSVGYMNNLTNPATHYKTGDEFHFDYTIAHYPISTLGFGLVGSYYKQVTGDETNDSVLPSKSGENASIGPAIMYSPKINGKEISMSLKWMREFNVTGRSPQEYLIWRVFMAF